MNIENKILNGYGEFVTYPLNKETALLTEEEYYKFYDIFSKYSAGCPANQYEDRFNLISKEINEINKNCKIAFIPKTLYELVLLRKIIKEDIKSNKCCPGRKRINYQRKICSVSRGIITLELDIQKTSQSYLHITDSEKRNRYINEDIEKLKISINDAKERINNLQEKEKQLKLKKCWHHIPIQTKNNLKDNDETQVKKISYFLNCFFAKKCLVQEPPFSYSTILKLIEQEFQFFQNYMEDGRKEESQNLPMPSFIKEVDSPTRLFRYVGRQSYGKSLAIWQESDKDFIRQVIQAECSEVAKTSIFLCRASLRDMDSPIYVSRYSDTVSLSFGTSLFAGIMHDLTATVWYLRLQKKNFYMIRVPVEELNSSCFYFPKANTICQLFSQGETFHARTLIPEGQNKMHGVMGGPGSSDICHLYTKMSPSEIKNLFNKFIDSVILESD